MKGKNRDFTSPDNLKKIGVVLFLAGFVFAQPLVAGVGALLWGGITLWDLFGRR